ncbi:MAG: PrsW family intramembrane metalloprotease [Bacteroidales bacterium]|nr:PrsW family intramembrane metalloprotease [Bacteroidales bacterium]
MGTLQPDLLAISLAPVIVILVYIFIRDKYEKEPIGLLLKALLSGGLITIPVMLVNGLLTKFTSLFSGYIQVGYVAFVVAGLTEEAFKFLALYLLIWKNRAFNERFDGIVYGVFVSLGFAAVENLMYVYHYGHQTGIIRALTAVPAHAIFGIAMGYYFGLARLEKDKRYHYMIRALWIPVLLHGIYDFILMSQHPLYLLIFIPFLFYLWKSGFKKMRILNEKSIFKNRS